MYPPSEEIRNLLVTADRVIANGLEPYTEPLNERRRTKKIDTWNKLLDDEVCYEEYAGRTDWPPTDWARFGRRLLLAKLILSTSEYLGKTSRALAQPNVEIIGEFSGTRAYEMIESLEEIALYGDPTYSEEQITRKIGLMDQGLIGFIKKHCDRHIDIYQEIDGLSKFDRQIKLTFNDYYFMIFEKIGRAMIAYIKNNPGGWMSVFRDIDKVYKEIYDSQKERVKLKEELEKNLLAQERIQQLEGAIATMDNEREGLSKRLSRAERSLVDEQMQQTDRNRYLQDLEAEKNALANQNATLLGQWNNVFAKVEEKRRELETREHQLEARRVEAGQEAQALLDEELTKIREMKNDLVQKEQGFAKVKREQENKINALSERLTKIRQALERGEKGSLVKSADAMVLEHSFINRCKKNVKSGIAAKRQLFKQQGVKWDTLTEYEYDDTYEYTTEESDTQRLVGVPTNKSTVLVFEKKHLIGNNEPQLIIEAGVISHVGSHLENGFDTVTVSLPEVLSRIDQSLTYRSNDKILHAIYLASPTGFDSSVIRHFSGAEVGKGLFYENTMVFLQDLRDPSSEPIYNHNDPKARLFTDILKMPLDFEHINICKTQIMKLLATTPSATMIEFKKKTGYDALYLQQALHELEKQNVIGKDIYKDFETVYFKH